MSRAYLLSIVLLLAVTGCIHDQNEGNESSAFRKEAPNNVDSAHPRILEMKRISMRLSLNTSGFWEAELPENHAFVYVPEGEFTMGSTQGLSNEVPVRKIHLDGYWMGKYPITVGQFRRFVEDTGHVTDAENGMGSWQWSEEARGWIVQSDGNWHNPYFEQGDRHPVVSVSWNDAVAYCAWVSSKLGLEIKLATAAQFEKGARGIDERKWPWGNEVPDGTRANYADLKFWNKYGDARHPDKSIEDGFGETSPVGSYPAGASPYGVMDMAGNVWEWNYDQYSPDYYSRMPERNPSGPLPRGSEGRARENRGGGSWTDRSGHITAEGGHNLRSAARTGDEKNSSDDHLGFRVVIDFVDRAPRG